LGGEGRFKEDKENQPGANSEGSSTRRDGERVGGGRGLWDRRSIARWGDKEKKITTVKSLPTKGTTVKGGGDGVDRPLGPWKVSEVICSKAASPPVTL